MDGSFFGGLATQSDQKSSYNDPGSGLTARLAVSPEVLREAWSLRHAAYSSFGYIDSNPSGLFMDDYDTYPSSKVVVVYKENRPVATVRICLLAPASGIRGSDAIPAMDIFRDEILETMGRMGSESRPARAVEVMRLARHPDLGADHEPVFALFRMAGCLIVHLEADAVISAVRQHHISFYRRLGFRKMTEPRPYPKLKFQTALMACLRPDYERVVRVRPLLQSIPRYGALYEDFMAGRPVPVFDSHSHAEAHSLFRGKQEHFMTMDSGKSTGPGGWRMPEGAAVAA